VIEGGPYLHGKREKKEGGGRKTCLGSRSSSWTSRSGKKSQQRPRPASRRGERLGAAGHDEERRIELGERKELGRSGNKRRQRLRFNRRETERGIQTAFGAGGGETGRLGIPRCEGR